MPDAESNSEPVPPTPLRRSPTRNRDGVTDEERRRPPGEADALLQLEARAAEREPSQLALFAPGAAGALLPFPGGMSPLTPTSGLDLARAWYRRELEQAKRPHNTIESYSHDLVVLEKLIGAKQLTAINRADIARFLGEANGRSTRKRRLTSVRRFFRFLIDDARVLKIDPTEGYYPHVIPLRSPVPLFAAEQTALLAAAADDEPWSLPAVWLMMRLGLGRGELLTLRREHIDLAEPAQPIVYIFYENPAQHGKERKLAADAVFASIHAAYLHDAAPVDLLFPFGPQAVNGMVDRVRKAAGLQKEVSPQTLRHTFAIDRARDGATAEDLLQLLGLADDPRNRESVSRYLKLAEPPL